MFSFTKGFEPHHGKKWYIFRMESFNSFFFFKDLSIHERHREREGDTGGGRSRLHAGSPTQDSIPGPQDQKSIKVLYMNLETSKPEAKNSIYRYQLCYLG